MHVVVCDATETALFEFPGGGTVEEYLNSNGLYPSSTHFYIRTQIKEHTFEEFESDGVHSDSQSSNTRPFVSAEQSAQNESEQNSLHPARLVCEICHCTFASGQSCIRCEQSNEYYASLAADSAPSHEQSENVVEASEEQNLVDIERLRDHRLSYILGNSNPSNADNSNNPDVLEEPPESPPVPTQKLLKVNRTHIKTDLIKHFKDPSI